MDSLTDFRTAKDEFFREDDQSPLTAAQKAKLGGLEYFAENPALRMEVDVEPASTSESISMQTTGGETQSYRRFGKFKLVVDGQAAELTIYENQNGYFLPFVDSLAGKETYPAGRYLEPEKLADGKVLVDFNLAYNPYCAYNDAWSCPITPAENRVKVAIRAGERIFKHEVVEGA